MIIWDIETTLCAHTLFLFVRVCRRMRRGGPAMAFEELPLSQASRQLVPQPPRPSSQHPLHPSAPVMSLTGPLRDRTPQLQRCFQVGEHGSFSQPFLPSTPPSSPTPNPLLPLLPPRSHLLRGGGQQRHFRPLEPLEFGLILEFLSVR